MTVNDWFDVAPQALVWTTAALHVAVSGANTHHMVEACFKGVGRALRQAIRREGQELPSTKGLL